MIRKTALALVLLLVAGCDQPVDTKGNVPARPVASIVPSVPVSDGVEGTFAAQGPATPARERAPAPSPRSEEALVEAVARAMSARDLTLLQASATPEFAADLRRMHSLDAASFWIKASAYVQNVKSGFEVLHRQEDTRDQWNIVVRFGNGQEERMTFTREDGKLRFVDL
ncbi:MAG: hypothetical protein QF464_19800 [Myxococcota bacterium]|nr:hypothetical protein [Myxococcota bacterium]